MPNLTAEQLRAFQERITLVDMIGIDRRRGHRRAGEALASSRRADARDSRRHTVSLTPCRRSSRRRDPAGAWEYDPVGFFLVFVDRAAAPLRVEQYARDRRLARGLSRERGAEEICHTIVRLGQVTLLPHAAYLGRSWRRLRRR